MNTKRWLLIRGMIVLAVCLGLMGVVTSPVRAQTCTWLGLNTADWQNPSNWSCDTTTPVPGADDDVVIPNGVVHDPEVSTGTASVKTLLIESGGHLTISGRLIDLYGTSIVIESGGQMTFSSGGAINIYASGGQVINHGTITVDPQLWIHGVGTFTNASDGEIYLTGTDKFNTFIHSYVPFNNNGDLDVVVGILTLYKDGTHSGSFTGDAASRLVLGDSTYPGNTNTFDASSSMKIPTIYVECMTVNMNGEYFPLATSTKLEIKNTCTTNKVVVDSDATFAFPQIVSVWGYGTKVAELVLEPQTPDYYMQQLELSGILTNKHNLEIIDVLNWSDGDIKGGGTTEIDTLADLTLSGFYKTLDNQQLTNKGTADWNSANIGLLNGSVFQNDGTFNANATTIMVEDGTSSFDNYGEFYKKTAGTTTTMDVTFNNNGSVEVITGTLILPSSILPGEGTVIKLTGGTLDAGDTLTVTESVTLTGSGTLDSNLVNAGLVSPGESPGLITVNGDYTQEISGTLAIELGGIEPGIEHDQLVVTGTATLDGTLDVTLLPPYSPSAGDRYTITTYATHTGVFDTVDLPEMPSGTNLALNYGATGITLDVTADAIEFTSSDAVTFTVGTAEIFTVTAMGNPTPTISLLVAQSDNLPDGVGFIPGEGDGMAVLSGTPAVGTGGVYTFTFGAFNGSAPDATQKFTLTVKAVMSYIYLPMIVQD